MLFVMTYWLIVEETDCCTMEMENDPRGFTSQGPGCDGWWSIATTTFLDEDLPNDPSGVESSITTVDSDSDDLYL